EIAISRRDYMIGAGFIRHSFIFGGVPRVSPKLIDVYVGQSRPFTVPHRFLGFAFDTVGQQVVGLPFWFLLLLSLAMSTYYFFHPSISPPGLCPKCGYDLRTQLGTRNSELGTSPRCPECGTPIVPVQVEPRP